MPNFIIQEIEKQSKRKARCSICGELIRGNGHRIKYGAHLYHIHCFYQWVNGALKDYTSRRDFLLKCNELLRNHMAEILAENVIKGGKT